MLLLAVGTADSGISAVAPAVPGFPVKIRRASGLPVNKIIQFSMVKKQDFFHFFLVTYREKRGELCPAVPADRAAVDVKAAGINSGGYLSLFLHRNQMIPVVVRIIMRGVMVYGHIRQSIKLPVQHVHFALAEIAPVIVKDRTHFPENTHIRQTSLSLLSAHLPSYRLLKFR